MRLHSGANELSFDVPQVPEYLVVDPAHPRIDRNLKDNIRRVDRPSIAAGR